MTDAPPPGGEFTSSWWPVDLEGVVEGTGERPRPTILLRKDGEGMVYAGRVHLFVGESEAGKTWVALLATAEVLKGGGRAVFVDFESDAYDVVSRLLDLGVSRDTVLERFGYVRPEEPITGDPHAVDRLVADGVQLVVFDGMSEAFALHGRDSRHEVDVAQLYADLARPFARAGAAVVMIDHTPLNAERELGSQHKRAGVDVSLLVRSKEPWTPGRENVAEVFRLKDRPAGIKWERSGNLRKVAHIVATPSAAGGLDIVLYPPSGANVAIDEHRETTAAQKRVLDAMTEDWEAARSVARRMGIRVRTVQDHLKSLVALDVVEARDRRRQGAIVAFEYRCVSRTDADGRGPENPRRKPGDPATTGAEGSSQVNAARNDADYDADGVVDEREDDPRGRDAGVYTTPRPRGASASSDGEPIDDAEALANVRLFLGDEAAGDSPLDGDVS